MSNINVIFNKSGKTITMQAKTDMMFAELAMKYAQKVGVDLDKDQIKFIFNSMELVTGTHKDLGELGIINMAKIDVVVGKDVVGAIKFKYI